MKKFHIIIKNLETGAEIVNDETNCIIGAFDADENGTASMAFSSCNTLELLSTVMGANGVLEKIFEEHPDLIIKLKMIDLLKKGKTKKEGGATE